MHVFSISLIPLVKKSIIIKRNDYPGHSCACSTKLYYIFASKVSFGLYSDLNYSKFQLTNSKNESSLLCYCFPSNGFNDYTYLKPHQQFPIMSSHTIRITSLPNNTDGKIMAVLSSVFLFCIF